MSVTKLIWFLHCCSNFKCTKTQQIQINKSTLAASIIELTKKCPRVNLGRSYMSCCIDPSLILWTTDSLLKWLISDGQVNNRRGWHVGGSWVTCTCSLCLLGAASVAVVPRHHCLGFKLFHCLSGRLIPGSCNKLLCQHDLLSSSKLSHRCVEGRWFKLYLQILHQPDEPHHHNHR